MKLKRFFFLAFIIVFAGGCGSAKNDNKSSRNKQPAGLPYTGKWQKVAVFVDQYPSEIEDITIITLTADSYHSLSHSKEGQICETTGALRVVSNKLTFITQESTCGAMNSAESFSFDYAISDNHDTLTMSTYTEKHKYREIYTKGE